MSIQAFCLPLSLFLPRVSSLSSLLLPGTSLFLSFSLLVPPSRCFGSGSLSFWRFFLFHSLSLSLSLPCVHVVLVFLSLRVLSFPSSSLCNWCAAAMSPVFLCALSSVQVSVDVWLGSYLLPTSEVAWLHLLYNQYIISSCFICCSSTSVLPFFIYFFSFLQKVSFFFLFFFMSFPYQNRGIQVHSKLYRFSRHPEMFKPLLSCAFTEMFLFEWHAWFPS